LKKVGVVSGFIKKSKSFLVILAFSGISQNCFFIEKVMHQVYGSRDHGCLSVHGGPATMGRRDRSGAREVIVVAQREREREEVVGVLTNDATWRRSCGDGHSTTLKRGSRWCSDGEMVPYARRRDWSQGGYGG
jgi:hypothetical protein